MGRVAADGFAGEPVEVVVAPLERAAGLLGCAGAVAGEAQRVFVIGNLRSGRGRGQLSEPIQLVVGAGGRDAVGIGDRDHVAGIVVGVVGGVVTGQAVIRDRAEAVLVVVGVGHRRAVRIGRSDGQHFVTLPVGR